MTAHGFAAVLFSILWATAHASADAQTQAKPTIGDIAKQQSQCVVMIVTADRAGNGLAIGSGFIVRSDGVVVTNHHVIDGAATASIGVANGDVFDGALILDADVRRDLAILKIKALNLRTCRLGDSDAMDIGQHVIAIGNPKGLSLTVSDGIVSGVRQRPGYRELQVTAPISHGSSGGPLLNDRGEVVGVTTATVEDGQNLNFAIPVNYLKPMVAALGQTRARTLEEYNSGRLQTAGPPPKAPSAEGGAPAPSSARPAAPKSPAANEAVLQEIKKTGLVAFLRQALGAWTEEQAKAAFGDPIRHRFSYDKNKTLDGDINAYQDPTRFVQYFELWFDIKTKKVRSVSLNRPVGKLTWPDIAKIWGEKATTSTRADGTKLYRYPDRQIDVIVDKEGNVVLIGLY